MNDTAREALRLHRAGSAPNLADAMERLGDGYSYGQLKLYRAIMSAK